MSVLEFFRLPEEKHPKVRIEMNDGKIIIAYIVALTSAGDGERNEDSLDYDFDTPTPGGFGDQFVLRPHIKSIEVLESVV